MDSLRSGSAQKATKQYVDALPTNASPAFYDVNAATSVVSGSVHVGDAVAWDETAATSKASSVITLSSDRTTLTLPAGQYDIRAKVLGGAVLAYQVYINGVAVPLTGTPASDVSFYKVLSSASTLSVKITSVDAINGTGSRLTVRRFGL